MQNSSWRDIIVIDLTSPTSTPQPEMPSKKITSYYQPAVGTASPNKKVGFTLFWHHLIST
jgi:hypothetical protein